MAKRKKKKTLTEACWVRVFQLRCRNKRGEYLSPDDTAFLRRAWEEDRRRYNALDKPVFEATKPFGA